MKKYHSVCQLWILLGKNTDGIADKLGGISFFLSDTKNIEELALVSWIQYGHLELRGKWRKGKSGSTLSIQNGDSINQGGMR